MKLNITRRGRAAVSVAAGLLLSAAITVAVSMVFFSDAAADHDHGDATAELRISAQRHDSGSVSVAVQPATSDRHWGDRVLPEHRFIPASAEPGRWLSSSAVEVEFQSDDERPLFCIVGHGTRDDYFWRLLRGFSRQAALDNNLNIRYMQSTDSATQVEAIESCSADGAAVIAATLSAPDAVTGPLLDAKRSGSRIVTFNSGYEAAAQAGSELHIALDDGEAGRLAAQEFNRHGATGTAACILHEAENVGLETRCDAFESVYSGGDVVRFAVPAGGNFEEVRTTIAERLADPEQPKLSVLFTLNGPTLLAALQAIVDTQDVVDHLVQAGSLGTTRGLGGIRDQIGFDGLRRISLFTINAAAEAQGYLITAAMHMAHSNPIPSEFITRPLIVQAIPFVYDNSTIRSVPQEERQVVLDRIDARLALGDEYFDD